MYMRSYATLALLLVLLAAGPSTARANTLPCPYTWQRASSIGSTGPDVKALQQLLNQDPATIVATSGTGSPGAESEYFGAKTATALSRFQEKYATEILAPSRLTRGTGSIGPRTRAKLNQLCASTPAQPAAATPASVQVTATENPALIVSRPEQPAMTIAPAGAGGVPFTNFSLTAGETDVVVRGITVIRAGAGADGAFESVLIADADGEEIADEKTLDSEHRAVFATNLLISAGTTATFTVYGNMEAELVDYEGQMPMLRVAAITASVPVSGALPIDGTAQTINASLKLGSGSASLSSFDPGMNRTIYINETGVPFAGIRISATAREDLELSGIEWEQAGSAGPSDIANVTTVIDGIAHPTEREGRVYASTFEPTIKIPRGRTIDVYVRGDIKPSAANRTVKFDLHESGAISLTGLQYGFDVGIAAASHTATHGNSLFLTGDGTADGNELTPFFSGARFTVSPGALVSVSRD